MAAPERFAEKSDSSCTAGAVHTWPFASLSAVGPVLPQGFDPANRKGLGMRIVRSFVKQIGGELRISQDDNNQGARFTVLFS